MKKQSIALRIALLMVWVAGILLPLYSFRRFSPSYKVAFDWVFHTHTSHVLMHTFLYAVLGCLVASFLPHRLRRTGWTAAASVLLVILAVAVLQETIQMRSERIELGPDEIFDTIVDLNGGMLGVLLFLWFSERRKKAIMEALVPDE